MPSAKQLQCMVHAGWVRQGCVWALGKGGREEGHKRGKKERRMEKAGEEGGRIEGTREPREVSEGGGFLT